MEVVGNGQEVGLDMRADRKATWKMVLRSKVFWPHVHQHGGWIKSGQVFVAILFVLITSSSRNSWGCMTERVFMCNVWIFVLNYNFNYLCLVAVQLVFEACKIQTEINLRRFHPCFCLHHFFCKPFPPVSFFPHNTVINVYLQSCQLWTQKKESDYWWLPQTKHETLYPLWLLVSVLQQKCLYSIDSLPSAVFVYLSVCTISRPCPLFILPSIHPSILPSSIPFSSPSNSFPCPSFLSPFVPSSNFQHFILPSAPLLLQLQYISVPLILPSLKRPVSQKWQISLSHTPNSHTHIFPLNCWI